MKNLQQHVTHAGIKADYENMQFVQVVTDLRQHDGMLESRQPNMQQHDTLLTLGTEASEGSARAEWHAETAACGLENSTAARGVLGLSAWLRSHSWFIVQAPRSVKLPWGAAENGALLKCKGRFSK